MPNKNPQKVSAGEASITGLPTVRWTSASGGQRTGVFGDEKFNPNTNSKIRLPGDATYSDLTLQTMYSTQYAAALDAWLQKNATKTDIVVVSTIDDLRYTFTGCAISTDSLYPGFDKDGTTTGTKTLEITLTVGGRNPLN